MAFENIHTKYQAQALDLPPAADLIAMLDDGETYASLAATFGCSPDTIRGRVNRSGLRTKNPAPASTPGAVTDAEDGETGLHPHEDGSSASTLPLLGAGQVPDWMDRGRCHETDPEAFFPEKGGSTREAKAICARCPVQAECLDYALDNDERFGIWGGLSERDRRKVKHAIAAEAGIELPGPGHNANKTHCVHGHAFTPDNTRQRADGSGRQCRTCERESQRKHRRTA